MEVTAAYSETVMDHLMMRISKYLHDQRVHRDRSEHRMYYCPSGWNSLRLRVRWLLPSVWRIPRKTYFGF